MEGHQNVIIAGANKCGTTSLFRYLSAHPQVTGSIIKEAGFFHRNLPSGTEAVRTAYAEMFGPKHERQHVLLEGTPTYLDGGLATARLIKETLPSARLIFLLREPADRLVSYYRSKQGLKSSPTYGLTFREFVAEAVRAEAVPENHRTPNQVRLLHQFMKGRYARNLEEFLNVFDAQQILVLFHDDLRASALSTTRKAAEFAGLDSAFYSAFNFSVENRSRTHRNDTLRTWATHMNHSLEPFLNRFPSVRRLTRSAYNFVNASNEHHEPLPADTIDHLREMHRNHNYQLRELLSSALRMTEFPDWLNSALQETNRREAVSG
jgi:hypothetical protein